MTPLERELRDLVAAEGPISVARYMALCLGHPRHGYYVTRNPIGAAGDFVTAPEVSQMFGELLGLWCADVWSRMGAPSPVLLVELGPGRGTLMADALRAAKVVPALRAALSVHLVETSPALRARQRDALAGAGVPLSWHAGLDEVPAGPMLLLANEFLDALPVAQFVRADDGWRERLVGLDAQGRLAFGLAPAPSPASLLPARCRDAPEGSLVEMSPAREAVVREIAIRVVAAGGAALLVDYGHAASAPGDTLQAMKGHAFADPLVSPGEADLTSHVDFEALATRARAAGAAVLGPATQGDFLRALGIEARAARLAANARAATHTDIAAALHRLTHPDAMGTLFKVMAIADTSLGPLPGFAIA